MSHEGYKLQLWPCVHSEGNLSCSQVTATLSEREGSTNRQREASKNRLHDTFYGDVALLQKSGHDKFLLWLFFCQIINLTGTRHQDMIMLLPLNVPLG